MTDQADLFFKGVGKERHVQLLEGRSGTVLVELKNGAAADPKRWYVTIHRGDVNVSHSGSKPDCVLRTDGKTFDAIVAGKLNAMPALLRGLVAMEGRVDLMVALQALFRPSAGATDLRAAGYAGRRS
jgi:putative sterol carrier protein